MTYSVQSNRLKLAGNAEHRLADTDDETTMDDELRQLCASLVAVPSMPYKQLREIAELLNREVRRKAGLSTFFTDYANSNISRLNH